MTFFFLKKEEEKRNCCPALKRIDGSCFVCPSSSNISVISFQPVARVLIRRYVTVDQSSFFRSFSWLAAPNPDHHFVIVCFHTPINWILGFLFFSFVKIWNEIRLYILLLIGIHTPRAVILFFFLLVYSLLRSVLNYDPMARSRTIKKNKKKKILLLFLFLSIFLVWPFKEREFSAQQRYIKLLFKLSRVPARVRTFPDRRKGCWEDEEDEESNICV